MSAARGALLAIYIVAIAMISYALFGPVAGDAQMVLVAIAVVLFGVGALLPANRSKDKDEDAR